MKVLFVCTGNIFRSMSAEYCLRDYMQKNNLNGVTTASAGIHAHPEPVHPVVKGTLEGYGIDISPHKQTKLNQEMMDEHDIVIAMAQNHVDFIKENFGAEVPLYNEIIGKGKTSVIDACDEFDLNEDDLFGDKVGHYIQEIVEYIHDSVPGVYKHYSK